MSGKWAVKYMCVRDIDFVPFNKQDLPMKNRAGYIKREIKNKISHRRNSSKIQWKHRRKKKQNRCP
jgi:hypothetical protein